MLSRLSLLLIVCLSTVSCTEPECLRGEIKIGSVCRRLRDASTDDDGSTEEEGVLGERDAAGPSFEDARVSLSEDAGNEASVLGGQDGAVDEDASAIVKPLSGCKPTEENVCGGCGTLRHEPGSVCNVGVGECAGSGTWECDGDNAVACSASAKAPTAEVCDGKDNDCDTEVDEQVASTWYQDCDSDGYAASIVGSIQACQQPAAVSGCSWTTRLPVKETHSNWDCNDSNASYSPAADFALPPAGSTDPDLNCDGVAMAGMTLTTMFRLCVIELADIREGKCTYLPPGATDSTCAYYADQAGKATATPDLCPDRVFVHAVAIDPTTGSMKCVETFKIAQTWTCK